MGLGKKMMALGAVAVLMVSALALVLVIQSVAAQGNGAMKGDLDQIRAQDGSCQDPTCDQDQIRAQDGSCQDPTCDQDRDRVRIGQSGVGDKIRDRDRSCW
ncbi:MAG: hypothetical protein A4E31_00308 [Methanomassiliicoccales archaeon PtaU1.Bin030]|nr:MAG: hypothetical protein A4E31_00308 [Methanomassiliicoccales archaeon PtaU1.Bin030]